MKRMKRSLSLLLCLLLAAAFLAPAAAGTAGVPKIALSAETAAPGGEVTVTAELSENPGLMAMCFIISYDRARLSLVGAAGVGLSGWDCTGDRILWLGNGNSSYNGTILQLNFRVLETAEPGETAVTLLCGEGDVADHDERSYLPAVTPGKVTVTGGGAPPAPSPRTEPAGEIPFTDVSAAAYYYGSVAWAYRSGVTTGRSKEIFDPEGTCSRGEVVTFLWRAAGSPEPAGTGSAFTDVSPSDYFYKPVLWAVEKGITVGTDAAHFSPKQTCSTAHIITFIYRALGVGTDGWYRIAGDWANGFGLLKDTNLLVDPDEACPRGAVVTFLCRWSLQH